MPTAGTDSVVTLEIISGANRVVYFDIPDTSQRDQESPEANLYFTQCTEFTKISLNVESIILSIRGDDAWLPSSFFISSLDKAQGRPELIVPLVHIPNWNLGWLSTDPNDENALSSVKLPLAR